MLLPIITFLLFDNPHDCFICLGKDPDRIYSSFQLSRQERTHRKMKAKYSRAQIIALDRSKIVDSFGMRRDHKSSVINCVIDPVIGISYEQFNDDGLLDESLVYRYGGSETVLSILSQLPSQASFISSNL